MRGRGDDDDDDDDDDDEDRRKVKWWKTKHVLSFGLHQGYLGSWYQFWENDHIIGILIGCTRVLGIYRVYQGTLVPDDDFGKITIY